MLTYPVIDPVAISLGTIKIFSFSLGPINVHWYGLMYLIGIGGAWLLLSRRVTRDYSPVKPEALEDVIFYAAMGVILGGRIGYVIFYHFSRFIADPLMLFKVWEGGMSFHGGLLGVAFAMWLSSKKNQCTMLELSDFVIPVVPFGLLAGRIGNFINAELWGRTTDVYWSFIFPGAGPLPRHPSQLYEAVLEGLVLFVVLWIYSNKQRSCGAVSGMFLMLYGIFRFIIEFYRVPDEHLGYLAMDWLTMGQILSTPMIIAGIILMSLGYKSRVN